MWEVLVVNIRRQTTLPRLPAFFFSLFRHPEEVDILLTVIGRRVCGGIFLINETVTERMMGSTYLHVRISGSFRFSGATKGRLNGFPSLLLSPSLFPTAVMDVQILGDEDSGPVDQQSACFGKAEAPARFVAASSVFVREG